MNKTCRLEYMSTDFGRWRSCHLVYVPGSWGVMSLYKNTDYSYCFECGVGTSSTAPTAKSGLKSCLLYSSRLHSLSLAMHSANVHLSIGNIIAILSLMVAIPCTAIMLWKVFWRQQRESHHTRTFWTVPQFVGQTSDGFKMI